MLATAILAVLAGAAIPAAPTRWVTDEAAFLSAETRSSLDAKLQAYESATHHQLVVWIGRTLDGAPLDDWAVRTFAAWKVGRKGFDDGIAMFILADDRTIDIEVGYGLEAKVPDVTASRIIRDVMTPKLRAGDRDSAVVAGVDATLAAIEGQPWTGTAQPAASDATPTWEWIVGALAGLAILGFLIKHPRLGLLALWSMGGGGGGGGGGFGGGGGRSGGGGARGSW